jgi:hypothetical protein
MRKLVLVGFLVCQWGIAGAQKPPPTQGPPGVEVVKYSWSKERIAWEREPFGSTAEGSNDVRARVSTERRRGGALEERQANAERAAKVRPPAPPRYAFNYKLSVRNAGPKAIREIDWDYVFTDAATGEELGRREFTSVEKIGPAKRKELSVLVSSSPTQRISVYALGKGERDGLVEQVIIVRMLYDDGTVWQRQ